MGWLGLPWAVPEDELAQKYNEPVKPSYLPDPEKFRVGDYVPDWSWDPAVQFSGINRLGDRYHPIEPFYKFDPLPQRVRDYRRNFWSVGFATACVGGVAWDQYRAFKPIFSQIYKHIAAGAVSYFLVRFLYDKSLKFRYEKEAVIKHYMELHPEDFPMVERKKYKNVLTDWVPIR